MSKTLDNLVTKALETDYANINGCKRDYSGVGKLESKYKASYNIYTDSLIVDHWGTTILVLDGVKNSDITVREFYGQSKSDRNAIAFILNYFNLDDYSVSYRPSLNLFTIKADFGTGTIEKRCV